MAHFNDDQVESYSLSLIDIGAMTPLNLSFTHIANLITGMHLALLL